MKILSVSNHPGGVNALIPVLDSLNNAGNCVHVITSRRNRATFKQSRYKLKYVETPISINSSLDVLRTIKPDLLLTGTSEPEDKEVGRIESVFIHAAKTKSITSITILDFWSKYRERFSLTSENALDALPDKICVMDQKAKNEMIINGFSEKSISVTGNPHWDQFRHIRNKLNKKNPTQLKSIFGIKKNQRIMVFISQPLSERNYSKLEYTELDVLKDIIKLIKHDPNLQVIELWIKPHPRDTLSKYDSLISKKKLVQLRLIGNEINVYDLGLVADFIIGMFSMLLVEYALLGFHVLSYQPVKNSKNLIVLGFGIPMVRKSANIGECLSKPVNIINSIDFNATDEILKEIRSL